MADEHRAVRALIERLVRDANLPDASDRDELRRELASHFEAGGDSPGAMRDALTRFGNPDVVSRGFRAAHRRGLALLYAAKVVTSVMAATTAALALELLANLRVHAGGTAVGIGDGYLVSACFAAVIVIVLVAAWELDIEPLCVRLERRPLRLLAVVGALFASIYFGHPLIHGPVDAGLVLVGSTAGAAVWTCTVAIVARLDLAFVHLFSPRR